MLDEQNPSTPSPDAESHPESESDSTATGATVTTRRRRAASRPAGPPSAAAVFSEAAEPAKPARATRSRKSTARSATTDDPTEAAESTESADATASAAPEAPAAPTVTKTTRTRKKAASRSAGPATAATEAASAAPAEDDTPARPARRRGAASTPEVTSTPAPTVADDEDVEPDEAQAEPEAKATAPARRAAFVAPLFQAPEPATAPRRKRRPEPVEDDEDDNDRDDEVVDRDTEDRRARTGRRDGRDDDRDDRGEVDTDAEAADDEDGDDSDDGSTPTRRRRRRGGRRRRKPVAGEDVDSDDEDDTQDSAPSTDDASEDESAADEAEDSDEADDADASSGTSRRRRRRRRRGEDSDTSADDPENTVVRVRERRSAEDEITSVSGSTRLEAKKQRRREGREAGRRRTPIVSEAEFLARRESVKREMVIRQRDELTQIAVLEDDVLVEHYVSRESQNSIIGNVYLGRVQNVLPSMEAAFVDIGKGRNAVLYAGEVDWSKLGDGKPRKIEEVLKSGQAVLVQVTKDPVGHKGARLTSQISLPGRFLVYVPGGQSSGISRKLPDTERSRLKSLLKGILPEDAGVIIRTAAEGATEDQLTRDVEALDARWKDIEKKSTTGTAPQLLYGEPDLTIKVVRDLFNEDFSRLVVEGTDASELIEGYVSHVAPDLKDRVETWQGSASGDAFSAFRIDEQIAKALDRKVWLPSGGSLIIDRTEAMTVVDVNTGKFTGSGGNLEETVTKNNLEAAEEIVRQLRLRDIGGIIVIDFIDMVLESNRDLVLRRLVECLGRDRTRHQVAEVTSLGLVQMTRKRIGTGLLEAFSEPCEHCAGRGIVTHDHPVESKKGSDDGRRSGRSGRAKRQDGDQQGSSKGGQPKGGEGKGRSGQQSSDSAPAEQIDTADATEPVAPNADVALGDAQSAPDDAGQDNAEASGPRKRRRRRSGGADRPSAPASDQAAPSEGAAPHGGLESPGTLDGGASDPALTGDGQTP